MQVATDLVITNDVNISTSSETIRTNDNINNDNQNNNNIINDNQSNLNALKGATVKVVYSIDFQANSISVGESLKGTLQGNKLQGYVWQANCYPQLRIYLYMEKQFESINKTRLQERFLH